MRFSCLRSVYTTELGEPQQAGGRYVLSFAFPSLQKCKLETRLIIENFCEIFHHISFTWLRNVRQKGEMKVDDTDDKKRDESPVIYLSVQLIMRTQMTDAFCSTYCTGINVKLESVMEFWCALSCDILCHAITLYVAS